jgi:hypothetical protein
MLPPGHACSPPHPVLVSGRFPSVAAFKDNSGAPAPTTNGGTMGRGALSYERRLEMTAPAVAEGRARAVRGLPRRDLALALRVCESSLALAIGSGASWGRVPQLTLWLFKHRYVRNMLSLLYLFIRAYELSCLRFSIRACVRASKRMRFFQLI